MTVASFLAVVSAVCFNASFIIEKQPLHHMPEIHAGRSVHMLRTLLASPRWVGGFSLSLFGLGCQVLALSKAPLSVVQPIVAAGIVVLLLLSHFVLQEHLGRIEWIGIAIVGLALFLIAVSLDTKTEDLGRQSSFWRLVIVAVPTALLSGAAFLAANRRERASAPLFGL